MVDFRPRRPGESRGQLVHLCLCGIRVKSGGYLLAEKLFHRGGVDVAFTPIILVSATFR